MHFTRLVASEGSAAESPVPPESCGMKLPGRSLLAVSRLLCPAVLLLALVGPSARPAEVTAPPAGEATMAAVKNQTRLRKLHLVRPDLIPYPIAFEVYC